MIIEYLYLIALILLALVSILLGTALWWWHKHIFWEKWDMLCDLHDRIYYGCIDAILGCKHVIISTRNSENGSNLKDNAL